MAAAAGLITIATDINNDKTNDSINNECDKTNNKDDERTEQRDTKLPKSNITMCV